MVKKRWSLVITALLIAGVAGFSGCRHHSHANKGTFMVDYISETLDLSPSQQEQLHRIKDELMEKAQQMHAHRESVHQVLVTQLRSAEIDQAQVKALIAEHRAQMDEIMDLIVVRLAEFHKTLTPEQKEKLISKIETFKKWHGGSWE
jgi:Spy/CpxP family protein refolding chaperone